MLDVEYFELNWSTDWPETRIFIEWLKLSLGLYVKETRLTPDNIDKSFKNELREFLPEIEIEGVNK